MAGRKRDLGSDFGAIGLFRTANEDLLNHPRGSALTANVRVRFSAPRLGIDVEEETVMRLQVNGYDEGQIDLDESGALSDQTLHLRYKPEFQDYTFETQRSLCVIGSSPKVGGHFSVVITPVE